MRFSPFPNKVVQKKSIIVQVIGAVQLTQTIMLIEVIEVFLPS